MPALGAVIVLGAFCAPSCFANGRRAAEGATGVASGLDFLRAPFTMITADGSAPPGGGRDLGRNESGEALSTAHDLTMCSPPAEGPSFPRGIFGPSWSSSW